MLKIALIFAVLAAVTASSIAANAKSKILLQVLTPLEMDEFLKQNPRAQPFNRQISPAPRDSVGQTRDLITYTLGVRQSGDKVVAYDSAKNTWATPQDVTLTIIYPASGTNGALITYMKIEVDQSNGSGRAYVTSGGVGYRYIKVVVESKATYWFNWVHNIYGI